MMRLYTEMVTDYVKSKGISVKRIAEVTGIPYQALYDSLLSKKRNRDLRADEFMAICEFIGKSPEDFREERKKQYKEEENESISKS